MALRNDAGVTGLRGDVLALAVGDYHLLVASEPPMLLSQYLEHAVLAEDFPGQRERDDSGYAFVAVGDGGDWPGLVVTQQYSPSGPGFSPGVLLTPGTRRLFIGAGTRLLSYQARNGRWRRAWEDEADIGFWGWRQHGDVVLMSAELQFAAWAADGRKLWSASVEPPWSYEVTEDDRVRLDVMGTVSTFSIRTGPPS